MKNLMVATSTDDDCARSGAMYLASMQYAQTVAARNARERTVAARRAIIYHQTDHARNNIQRASLARTVSGNNSCPGICIIYSRQREISSMQRLHFGYVLGGRARARDHFDRCEMCSRNPTDVNHCLLWRNLDLRRKECRENLSRVRVRKNHWMFTEAKFDNSCDWRPEVLNFRKLDSDV
jgi:hypothetical protein